MSRVVTLKVEHIVSADFSYSGQRSWCTNICGLSDSARKDILGMLAPWTVKNKPLLNVMEKQDRFGATYLLIGSNPFWREADNSSLPDDLVNMLLNILARMGLKVVGTQQGQTSTAYYKDQTNLFIWTLQ